MGLARDLFELESKLRQDNQLDLFSSRGAYLDNPEVQAVLATLNAKGLWDSRGVVTLCLQSLWIQYEELAPHLIDAELVATIPPESPGLARSTGRVIQEMLDSSTKEIIVLGYEFTDAEMVRLLAAACTRGVEAIVICDRGKGGADRIRSGWPDGLRLPRLFHDLARSDAAPHASMHAKCVLVDGANLLVTSANFTFHGMRQNIEIGVRLRGWPAAEARKIFSHLVENGLVAEHL